MTDRNANVVLTADPTQYQRSMQQAQDQTNALTNSVKALTSAIGNITKTVGKGLTIFGAAGLTNIAATTAAAASLESKLHQLNATAVLTGRSMATYTRQLDQVRRGMAVSTDQAIALFTQLSKLGQNQAQLKNLSETFIRLGAVTGESIGGLTNGLISLQRAMNVTGSEYTTRFASSLANLSAKAGVSAQSVLDFSNAIAPISKVAGLSTQQILGFSTSFVKAGQDGYAAANTFNKMLTDITRSVQYGSPELKYYADLIGKTTSQFKNMPRAEALIEIFDTLNKQGPNAIKTLDALGYDGIRSIKAIQAVSNQSGGIQGAINTAVGGYSNTGGFTQASNAALDGLTDQLQRLRNVLQTVGEQIGATFLPIATKFVGATATMAGGIARVLDPVSKLLGGLTAIGTIGAIGLGALAMHFTKLAAAASLVQIGRSLPVRGFSAGYSAAGNPEAVSYATGQGTGLQRAMYRGGFWLGNQVHGFNNAMAGAGPGLMNRLSAGSGWAVGQVGQFIRYGLEPLFPGQMMNSFNRASPVGEWADRAGPAFGAGRAAFSGMRGAGEGMFSSLNAAAVAARTTMAMSSVGTASTRVTGLFSALAAETGRLAVATARAGLGLGMGVGRLGMSGLAAAGRGIMGFLGGPIGLGLTGAMALQTLHAHNQGAYEESATMNPELAAGAKYRTALGEAAQATSTFADAVNAASAKIDPSKSYTDPAIAKMNQQQATAYYRASNLSPQGTALLKADLTKRFGSATADQIIAGGTGNVDLQGLFGAISPQKLIGPLQQSFWTTGATKAASGRASATVGTLLQRAGSQQDRNRITTAAFNSAAAAFRNANGEEKAEEQIVAAMVAVLGLPTDDKKSRDALYNALKQSSTADARSFLLKAGNSSAASQQLGTAFSGTGAGFNMSSTSYIPGGVMQSGGDVFSTLRGTVAAGVLGAGAARSAASAYLNEPGNAGTLNNAANQLAASMVLATGSTARAINELDRMAATAGSTESDLYKLAQAAKTVAQFQQSWGNVGLSSVQMAQQSRQALIDANALPDDATGVKASAQQSARAGLLQTRQDVYSKAYQIVVASRELSVQTQRAWEDFNKSRMRAEEDFSLQRYRSERNYNIQRKQQTQDFYLSRKRAEQDFNYSVQEMAKQTARTVYDVYQRVTVQQSMSGTNLAANLIDQNQRLAQQQKDLASVRGMGLSGATIQMLGLNEAQNAQQLSRLVQDLMQSPQLVKQLNDQTKARLAYGKKIVTDQDSLQWQEMLHSFKQNQERGLEDFNRSMARQQQMFRISLQDQAADFSKAMERQRADMQLSQRRAIEDLNRSATEITLGFEGITKKAVATLSGMARAQMAALVSSVSAGTTQLMGIINNFGGTTGTGGKTDAGSGGGTPSTTGTPSSRSANVALAKQWLAKFGWSDQFTAFNYVEMHEAGYNNTAQNPTSTAYGMGQFLDSTWATVGGHKTSDPSLQLYYMMKYIKQRYGDPNGAARFWASHHWYQDGALFNGAQTIGVGEKGPEAVLPLNQRGVDFILAVMKKHNTEIRNAGTVGRNPMSVGNTAYYSHVDHSTKVTGPITVQASDPNEMMRKLEAKKRRDRLVSAR